MEILNKLAIAGISIAVIVIIWAWITIKKHDKLFKESEEDE